MLLTKQCPVWSPHRFPESDPEFEETTANPSLCFKCLPLFTLDGKIHCNASTSKTRPIASQSHHRKVIDHFHGLSHARIRSTTKTIGDRFIWKKHSA